MTHRLPLRKRHDDAGAAWVERWGWEVPAHYGDARREHGRLRSRAGILDVSCRGRLAVRGRDRVGFLQGMVTGDVKALAAGSGCRAVAASVKGRILADLRIDADADALWLDLPPGRSDPVAAHLRKHIVSEEAEVLDVGAAFGVLALVGPSAAALVGAMTGAPPPALPPRGHAGIAVAGTGARLAASRRGAVEGFDLWVPAEAFDAAWDLAVERGRGLGAAPAGMEALNALRIEEGIGWYGEDFDESNFPQEAGLDDAISTTKGCYLGQEVIARIHFQGHVNRRLAGLALEGEEAPAPGAEVAAGGAAAGTVTSAVRSPTLGKPIALALLRKDATAAGTAVTVEGPAGPIAGRVVELPFVR